ncbi:hypothetical protein U8V72_20010 [Priestia filamentosa]|uniref:ankyrin repeat domain-containing protein n=1 Tax=Priestia filamentosa TaxID=1402861 RepID=UPI00397D60FD
MDFEKRLEHIKFKLAIEECTKNPAFFKQYEDKGFSLLLSAFHHQEFHCVTELLQQGAQVNVIDEEGKTPLTYAVEYCESDVVENIFGLMSPVYRQKSKALVRSIRLGQVKTVKQLLNLGLSVQEKNKNGESLLLCALNEIEIDPASFSGVGDFNKEQLKIINLLLEHEIKVGQKEKERIQEIGKTENILSWGIARDIYNLKLMTTLTLFIENGVSAHRSNSSYPSVFETFMSEGNEEWIAFILKHSHAKDIKHTKYILNSIKTPSMLKLLLENGVDPNTPTPLTSGALHEVSKKIGEYYNKESVQLLLDFGSDVNLKNKHGWTPIVETLFYNEDYEKEQHELFNLIMSQKPNLYDIDVSGGFEYKPVCFDVLEPTYIWNIFEFAISQNRYHWFKLFLNQMTEKERELHQEVAFLHLVTRHKEAVRFRRKD